MVFRRDISWARATKGGIPPLIAARAFPPGYTPRYTPQLKVGEVYPAPDPDDKMQVQAARRFFERRWLRVADPAPTKAVPPKAGREKKR